MKTLDRVVYMMTLTSEEEGSAISHQFKIKKKKEYVSMHDTSVTLILRPNRDITKKFNYRQTSLLNIDTNLKYDTS